MRGLALVRERCDNEDDASEGTDWDDGDATRGGVGCGGATMAKVRSRSGRGVAAVSSGVCRSGLGADRVFSCAKLPPSSFALGCRRCRFFELGLRGGDDMVVAARFLVDDAAAATSLIYETIWFLGTTVEAVSGFCYERRSVSAKDDATFWKIMGALF